jgi:hypothetical protein
MDITFAIIGTAGREEDGGKLGKKHFEAMYLVADELIKEVSSNGYPITKLVSGGAAWADHVAVKLFLDKKIPKLKLCFPCEWEHGSFKNLGENTKFNPGKTANYYHNKFKNTTFINSLSEIQTAILEGAEYYAFKGFHARNAIVAKSDFLLAMTFGNKHEVKDGGTAHTVQCYLNRVRKEFIFDKSFHYDLNSGEIFAGCTLPKGTKTAEIV